MKESQELLVSIIVPVYNVEIYLEECIESILNQTYEKVELILVDDGSTDMSGVICDFYAREYSNIIVIHKVNGGLSDARNVGLERARGDYISFIDSDDYVEETFIEDLLSACLSYDVSVSCTRWRPTNGNNRFKKKASGSTFLLDSEDALLELLNPSEYLITTSVWDRLYRKDILNEVTFPKGKCYEDTVFSPTIINRAKRIAYVDKELYNYRIRQGSITNPIYTKLDRRIITDKFYLAMEQLRYFKRESLDNVYIYYKCIYYQEIMSVIGKNVYSEYNCILDEYLKMTKPTFKEIMSLRKRPLFIIVVLIKKIFSKVIIKIYKLMNNINKL